MCGPPCQSPSIHHSHTELCINQPFTFTVVPIHMCPKLYTVFAYVLN